MLSPYNYSICRDDAKKLIASWFPGGIYDTKHLASTLPDEMELHETSLGQLFSNLTAIDSPQVCCVCTQVYFVTFYALSCYVRNALSVHMFHM
jgi:hypothetical protein